MTDAKTNLRRLKISRRKPEAGDVFVMQLPDGAFLPGLVVGADLQRPFAPMTGSYLIYVYDLRLESKAADLSLLTPDRLLIPPTYTNRMAWTKGYFETVQRVVLGPDVVVAQYCFWSVARGQFVDETDQPLPGERPPSGNWALVSYRRLDDLISDAVSIPRVPEDSD